MRITRRDNDTWKRLRGLAELERERQSAGETLLDGIHLLQAFAAAGGTPSTVVVSDSGQKHDEVARYLEASAPRSLIELPDAMFEQLSTVKSPTGIIAVIAIPKASAPLVGSCVVLDNIQDPGNVGAILRSAAAAGLRHAVVSHGSARAWSPRVLRAAMGAHFNMTIHDNVNVPEALASYDGAILTTEANAPETCWSKDLTGNIAWVLGSEGAGVTAEVRAIATGSVAIPIAPGTESLNVAAAAAICLFEQRRQLLHAR